MFRLLTLIVKNPVDRDFLNTNDLVHYVMETLKIDIIKPKARKMLEDLADMNLIAIQKSNENVFKDVLRTLRTKNASTPTPEEIANDVEIVRTSRYNKQ